MLRKIHFLCLVAFALLYKDSLPSVLTSAVPYPSINNRCLKPETEYVVQNLCCSKCHPGYRKKEECTASTDTVCEPCRDGTYINKMNYANCFRCTLCREENNMIYTRNCSRTTDSKCACKEGMFCSWKPHQICEGCSLFTACPPGKGVSKEGTPESDVTCERCKEGTFSDQTSYTQKCMMHTNCASQGRTVLHSGNSTADNVCSPIIYLSTTRQIALHVTTNNVSPKTDRPTPNSSQSLPAISLSAYVGIAGIIALLLIIVITAILLRKKKADGNNNDKDVNKKFLNDNSDHNDPSISSASSRSESSQGAWVGPSVVESSQMNVSVMTTINYSLIPGVCTQTHAIPRPDPKASPAQTDSDFPLSQEEVVLPSQCDEGKDVRVAIQESGKNVC